MMNLTTLQTQPTTSDFAPSALDAEASTPVFAPSADAVVRFETAMSRPIAENAALQRALESIIANFDAVGGRPVVVDERQIDATPAAVAGGNSVTLEKPIVETPAAVVGEKPVVVEKQITETPAAAVGEKPVVVEQPIAGTNTAAVDARPVVAEAKPVDGEVDPAAVDAKGDIDVKAPARADAKVASMDVKVDEEAYDSSELQAPQAASAAVAAPAPAIDPSAGPAPVAAVSPAILAKVEAATAAEILVEAATAVADTMLVTPGLAGGEGEVRIQLKPDVLAGTELRISVSGADAKIEFAPTVERIATLIAENQSGLVQHLAERVGNLNFAVVVNRENLRAASVGLRARKEAST